jgi:hypothetical protein
VSPRDNLRLRGPEFPDPELGYATVVCGTTVKGVLPQSFDPGDEDSCRRCVGPALRGGDATDRWAQEEPTAELDHDQFIDIVAVRVLDGYRPTEPAPPGTIVGAAPAAAGFCSRRRRQRPARRRHGTRRASVPRVSGTAVTGPASSSTDQRGGQLRLDQRLV